MSLVDNYQELRKCIAGEVMIVAVSKTKPVDMIMQVYKAGHRDFGENKVQELTAKQKLLPEDIRWHLIGHLQTNKVKFIAPFIYMIQSVDSLKLLTEINKEAARCGRVINCLLEFRIATEESKFGLSFDDAVAILNSQAFADFRNVKICGVMGMATFTDDIRLVESEFRNLRAIFENLKDIYFRSDPGFREISMGMSGDYQLAITQGSTMVRIGSLIFGER